EDPGAVVHAEVDIGDGVGGAACLAAAQGDPDHAGHGGERLGRAAQPIVEDGHGRRSWQTTRELPPAPHLTWGALARRYYVRTFGCQMNEHDSERIAGLLEADGLERAESVDGADVVVLNTCCIRENADSGWYGTLGHLTRVKDARPDLQIVVAGCLAQKDRDVVRQRAPYVDVVLGTHNVHRTAELVADARVNGPRTEIWDEPVTDDH